MSTAPAAPPEVHFTAKDFAFEGPDTVASQGGVAAMKQVTPSTGPAAPHLAEGMVVPFTIS